MTAFIHSDKDTGVKLSDRDDRARRAVTAFRAMQPTLSAYARILTKNPAVRVEMASHDNGSTDGKRIFFRPPIELGDRTEHRRSDCNRRDEQLQVICPACRIREEVLIVIYHEIAHIWFETFAPISNQAKNETIQAAIKEHGTKYAQKIDERVGKLPTHKNYMELASIVSPWLPQIFNGLEDARINAGLFGARKGTKVMFDALVNKTVKKGIERPDGKGGVDYQHWYDQPLNSQASVALFSVASGYPVHKKNWFSPEVNAAMNDPMILSLCRQVTTLRKNVEVYRISFDVLARMRELGFFRSEKDPEDETPQPEEGGDSEDTGSEGDSAEESEPDSDNSDGGDPGDSSSPGGTDSDGEPDESGDAGDGEGNDSSADENADADAESGGDSIGKSGSDESVESESPPSEGGSDAGEGDEVNEEDDASAESDPGESSSGGDDEVGDDSRDNSGSTESGREEGDETSSDDAEEGSSASESDDDASPGGSDSDRSRGERDQDGSNPDDIDEDGGEAFDAKSESVDQVSADGNEVDESDGETSEGSPSGTDPDEGMGDERSDSEDDGESSQDGTNSSEPSDPDRGESSDNLDDADEPGEVHDDDLPGEPADPVGGADSPDFDGESNRPNSDVDDDPDDVEPVDQEPAGNDEGDSDPIDTGADEGTGGVEVKEQIEYGDDPEEAVEILNDWMGHKEKPKTAEMVKDDKAVDKAIVQGLYFETPSSNVYGVREHRWDQPIIVNGNNMSSAWRGAYGGWTRKQLGIDGEFDATPESILGPALLEMRVTFAENKKGKNIRNLKSGKIRTASLGKRAPANDERMFKRKVLPGKRKYFVVIAVDVSGSTAGLNLQIAKAAAFAQATLLHRMGIEFCMYAYTCDYHDTSTTGSDLDLEIYVLKEPNEPWDKNTQQRVSALGPDTANIDGHTLEYLRKKCDAAGATDCIILYYSDGKFPAENHDEELIILQREIAICKQKGYTLLGVGIRTDSPIRHGMDTVQLDSVADTGKVIKHLRKAILAR